MKKLPLTVKVEKHLLFPKQIPPNFRQLIRLEALISFLNRDRKSVSKIYTGILDTGAPVSVIPHLIWNNLHLEIIGESRLVGVHQGKECQIPCHVGKVLMRMLSPQKQVFFQLKPLAYLVPEEFANSVPLILGFDQCLQFFRLEADIPKQKAFLVGE